MTWRKQIPAIVVLSMTALSRRHPRAGKEAGDSRIWGGIHYPMDNQAGVTLGAAVANVVIEWAKADGSK